MLFLTFLCYFPHDTLAGASNLLASLGHARRRRVVLGHILNTQTLMKTDEQKKKVLSKFTILCWASFIAILDRMLDLPVTKASLLPWEDESKQ